MIALITSTLLPDTVPSYFNVGDRLEQTKLTLSKLHDFDFQEIILIDNSHSLDQSELNNLLLDFPGVKKYHSRQYQFNYKGLTEALLLLNNLHNIPADVPLFKISGRYYPNESFEIINTDF